MLRSNTYDKEKLHCSPCQANVLGMVLNKDIEDLTVMADARRKLRQRLSDLFPFVLLLIFGLRFVENDFQVIEALELLYSVESGASAGVQLEYGKRLFEGVFGRIG